MRPSCPTSRAVSRYKNAIVHVNIVQKPPFFSRSRAAPGRLEGPTTWTRFDALRQRRRVGKAPCDNDLVDASEPAARRALSWNHGDALRSLATDTTTTSRCMRQTGACRQPDNGPGGSIAVPVEGNASRDPGPAVNGVRHTLEVLASRYRSRPRS